MWKNILEENRKIFISLVVALLCIVLSVYFPANNIAQKLTKELVFLVFIPILYIKLILKKDLSAFGLNFKNKTAGFFWGIAALTVSFLLVYGFFRFTSFSNGYVLPAYIIESFRFYLFYELILVNFFVFSQAFFFQGFLLSLLREKIGFWSIGAQTLVYIAFVTIGGSLNWLILPYLIANFTGAVVAYKTKSVIHSYLLSLLFIIILDAVAIRLFF